jgi:hypothetical protein
MKGEAMEQGMIDRLVKAGFEREYALSLKKAGLVTEEFTHHVELGHALVTILRDPKQREKAAEIKRLLRGKK